MLIFFSGIEEAKKRGVKVTLLALEAIETKHPAMIQEVKLTIRHDPIMEQLKGDFGKKIEEKYGKDFFDLM